MKQSKPTPRHPVVLLIDELARLMGRLQGVFASASANIGLSRTELMVLTAVVESNTPPTVPKIGRSLGRPRQVVQRAANDLIKANLLKTEPNPDHKRAQLLQATAAGKKVYGSAEALGTQAANALSNALNLAQIERLAREIRELRGKIEDHLHV